MAITKILTYEKERIIRPCYAEETNSTEKEKSITESLKLLENVNAKLWKLEDISTGTLLGYEIQDVSKNSIKRFIREGKM